MRLDTAPQTRLALVRLSDHDTLFVWTFNLMLQDGWGFPLILTDAFNAYEALRQHQEKGSEELRW